MRLILSVFKISGLHEGQFRIRECVRADAFPKGVVRLDVEGEETALSVAPPSHPLHAFSMNGSIALDEQAQRHRAKLRRGASCW